MTSAPIQYQYCPTI